MDGLSGLNQGLSKIRILNVTNTSKWMLNSTIIYLFCTTGTLDYFCLILGIPGTSTKELQLWFQRELSLQQLAPKGERPRVLYSFEWHEFQKRFTVVFISKQTLWLGALQCWKGRLGSCSYLLDWYGVIFEVFPVACSLPPKKSIHIQVGYR